MDPIRPTRRLAVAAACTLVLAASPVSAGGSTFTELDPFAPDDVAAGDDFGLALASHEGQIVVGAPSRALGDVGASGSVYLFDVAGDEIVELVRDDPDPVTNDSFGQAVAFDGATIAVGVPFDDDNGTQSGSVYLFDTSGTQLGKIVPDDGDEFDFFGASVALGDGIVVVGAPSDDDAGNDAGAVYVFALDGTELDKFSADDTAEQDQFGSSVAVDAAAIAVGASQQFSSIGQAYLFDLAGEQLVRIDTPDAETGGFFGSGVALAPDRVIVTAPLQNADDEDAGAVHFYDRSGTLVGSGYGDAPGVRLGASLATDGGLVVAGASGDNDDDAAAPGFAVVFDLDGDVVQRLVPVDGSIDDLAGSAVGVSGRHVVVGAPDGGVDVDASGLVHVFQRDMVPVDEPGPSPSTPTTAVSPTAPAAPAAAATVATPRFTG